jgi:uncharacterized protein YndB with AHSA1/START domain
MIDVDHQISSVQRTVGARVLDAGETRVVTLSRVYDTDIDDLWDACTSAERIPRWFLPVEGDLRVGGRYQLVGNAGGVIESCDPPHRFSATWEMGDDVSWIEVVLTADSDGTRFTLEHVAHVDEDRWLEYGPGAVGVGWDLALIGLAEHLTTGAAVDPEAAAAWGMTTEGVAFIERVSEAWADASAAAGTDPAEARLAGRRTTAFYTGQPEPEA